MSVYFDGIVLEPSAGPVTLTHSLSMDMITGKSSTQNMDWTDILADIPWDKIKNDYHSHYENAGRLFSLLHMDYQVCNGGIAQYFFNGYDQARAPYSEDDVELYDIDQQKEDFSALVKFGRAIFPEREAENQALSCAAESFSNLFYERDALVSDTVYCEEDEYIMDEETGELVENPDYFEPYEESYREDVIHGNDSGRFDDIFYKANEYMEELLELRAQYISKKFMLDALKDIDLNPEVSKIVNDIVAKSTVQKPSLTSKIQSAESCNESAVQDNSNNRNLSKAEPEL